MGELGSVELVERVRQGDQQAERALFDRYVQRLIGLARSRLSPQLARRVAPDDIVLSVFRSFLQQVQQGEFVLQESGDLWRLLAAIAVNKVRRQVRFHTAQRRDITDEASVAASGGLYGLAPEAIATDPSPSDAAALQDELRWVLEQLPPRDREIIRLRLQGSLVAEVAKSCDCSERKVYRVSERFKTILEGRLMDLSGA